MSINRLTIIKFALLIIIAFILTTILTWPLAINVDRFYESGDYSLNGWILIHMQKSILSGKIFDQISLFNPGQFYPLPYTLAFSNHLFIPSLLFIPFYLITQNLAVSVNLLMFFSFIFTFITCFLFINYFLKKYFVSLVGATIFSFNPITMSSISKLQLMNKYFLPLVFLFFYKFLEHPSYKNGFFFFLFFTLNSLTANDFQIFTVIILPVLFFSVLLYKFFKKEFTYIKNIMKFSLLFLIFLPFLSYFNIPYLDFSNKEIYRTIDENKYYSARLNDFLFTNESNLIYGNFVGKSLNFRNPKEVWGYINISEHSLFTNITPTLLFFIGFFFLLKNLKKNTLLKMVFFLFFYLMLFSLILMFGPYFLGWNDNEGTIKLPFFYIYSFFKPLEGIRVPTRFQFIFYIPFALFASYGYLFISTKFKLVKKVLVTFILILIIALENYTPSFFYSTPERVAELKWLKNNSNLTFLKNKITLHLPTIPFHNFDEEASYLNWPIYTEEILMNGYSGYIPDDWIEFIKSITTNFNQDSIKKLKVLGINYIIVHKENLTSSTKNKYSIKPRNWLNVTYEDKKIIAYNLDQYNFIFKKCKIESFNPHISLARKASVSEKLMVTLHLKNSKNCFLLNKFQDRYIRNDIKINNMLYVSYFKMPPLIEPYKNYELKTYLKKYKNIQDYHTKGVYNINIYIKKLSLSKNQSIEIY